MRQLDMQDVEAVSGAGFFGYIARKFLEGVAIKIGEAVVNGEVDYSGIAESQGTYFNTVGA